MRGTAAVRQDMQRPRIVGHFLSSERHVKKGCDAQGVQSLEVPLDRIHTMKVIVGGEVGAGSSVSACPGGGQQPDVKSTTKRRTTGDVPNVS